ncbi:MAG TPA: fibronectin type III domain-containing protein [Pyrinomonadaceae bacterium]|nr:fibronectin type III domain-containing protein [Pyrinomonadaceae bacterium]
MAKVKLNLRELSIPEKIARARQIVNAMSSNPNFPTPQPALAQVTGVINDLEATHSAQQSIKQQAKALTTAVNEKEEAADRILNQLAAYVESTSGGDEQTIQSAGMDVRAERTPTGTLPAPDSLNPTLGDMEGEIDLSWDKVDRARSYVIEQSVDPVTATSWHHAAVSTKSQTTIDGLTTGTKYWFRVAAVGPQGQGPWSNPAFKIAP